MRALFEAAHLYPLFEKCPISTSTVNTLDLYGLTIFRVCLLRAQLMNWSFMNSDIRIRSESALLELKDRIKAKHGAVTDLKVTRTHIRKGLFGFRPRACSICQLTTLFK